MSCERVSRWFAIGFRCGEDGRRAADLPLSQCENEWQRMDMKVGYEEASRGQAHLQFWLVSGGWTHAEVEGAIVTANDAKGREGGEKL
jgi:hypothetical protein